MIEPGKPEKLTDGELVEALELAASRIRMAAAEDLRHVGDAIAGLALEAGGRLRELQVDHVQIERRKLREKISRLEDAAFHFQTCATCRRDGEGACTSGRWFAAYLRGEHDEEGERRHPSACYGKIRNVTIHADGRLTADLEVEAGGAMFEAQIKGTPAPSRPRLAAPGRGGHGS